MRDWVAAGIAPSVIPGRASGLALCLGGHAAVVSFEQGRYSLAEIELAFWPTAYEERFPIEATQMAER